jgi:hypothetical protein
MSEPDYATPEEAAVATFLPQYVQVDSVDYSRDGSSAVVKLMTNDEAYLYPYYVHCARDESGRWIETGSHN